MKSLHTLGVLSLSALCLLSPLARGGGLDKGRIPANARWLAHVDVEALTHSTLFAALRDKDPHVHIDGDLAQIKEQWGLDPFVDLKSITLYCTNKSPERSVIVIVGSEKLDTALARVQKLSGYHTEQDGTHALHVWAQDNSTWYGWMQRREGTSERVAILCENREDLVSGLAVLEGKRPSLATQRESVAFGAPAPGSIVFAAATENLAELHDLESASRVFKLAETMSIDLGEDHDAFYLHAVVDAKTPEDALKIQQVLQGAVALVGLMGEKPDSGTHVSSLLGALHFGCSGSRLTADFRYDVKALLETLEALDDHDGDDESAEHVRKK